MTHYTMNFCSFRLVLGVSLLVFGECGWAGEAAKTPPPEQEPPRSYGNLAYPAFGNIHFDEGTVEMWVVGGFNVADKFTHATPFNIRFLDDGTHLVLLYLSRHFAFIGYVKPKRHNYVWSGLMDWKSGEPHHIALSWKGNMRSIYLDGQVAHGGGAQGDPLQGPGRPDISENVVVEGWMRGNLSNTELWFGAGNGI